MYTVSPGVDFAPDEPFHGFRVFWSTSYHGAHLTAYDEGVALGKADLEANVRTNLDALLAYHDQSDLDWNAKADGYSYATRSKGPNELRRYA